MKRIVITMILASITAAGALAISQAAATSAHPAKNAKNARLRPVRSASASAATALPKSAAESLTAPGGLTSEFELEPTRASYRSIGASNHVWVVPGRNGLCLVIPAPDKITIDAGCGSLASVAARGIVSVMGAHTGRVIYGYVPNGATVTVTNAAGLTAKIPVSNGVFMDADPSAASIAIRLPDGSVAATPVAAGA